MNLQGTGAEDRHLVVPWDLFDGWTLKAARHILGLEQIDLANAAGIAASKLSRMENCDGKPVRGQSAP
jgi:hypothetical protein